MVNSSVNLFNVFFTQLLFICDRRCLWNMTNLVDGCFCELCVSLPSVPMDLVVISVVKTKKKILRRIRLAAIIQYCIFTPCI